MSHTFFRLLVTSIFASTLLFVMASVIRNRRRRWQVGGVLIAFIVTTFLVRVFAPFDHAGARILTMSGLYLGFVSVISFVPIVLVYTISAIARRLHVANTAKTEIPPQASRRDFLERSAALSVVGVSSIATGYAMAIGRTDFQLEEVSFRLARLPRGLSGLTIAQISDIHVGEFVREAELRRAEELIRRAHPDVIVMTGDLLDHDRRHAERLAWFVRRLSGIGARFGVVAIPGNHDYYAGVNASLQAVVSGGGKVLRNSHTKLVSGDQSITLAGVDDLWTAWGADLNMALWVRDAASLAQIALRPPATLYPALQREECCVLLCHQPPYFDDVRDEVDLQLSGHTHGGQFTPGINAAALVLPYPYIRGAYSRPSALGTSHIYVNRGFGTAGPPVRLGCTPEITKLILTA